MQALKNFFDSVQFDFVGKRKPAAVVSLFLVIASWVVFFTIGPNWGIDFEGGTEIEIAFTQDVKIGDVRAALDKSLHIGGDAVQSIGTPDQHQYSIRIKEAGFGMDAVQEQIRQELTTAFGPDWIQNVSSSVEVGALVSVAYKPDASGDRVALDKVRAALKRVDNAQVQEGRDEYEVVIALPGLSSQVQKQIKEAFGDEAMDVLSVQSIGPKVGADLARQGAISVLATLGLVLVYVAFRFELTFAPGAVLALFHDVSITIGVFVLLQREFNLPMIGALLTIVGYSLNDTIIIYDRIRENLERYRRTELEELINVSINETLSRTLATSFTTMLAISAFLFMGGDVINNFAIAMTCGIFFGTYSTVYVASPTILVMRDLQPYFDKFMVNTSKHDENVVLSSEGAEGEEMSASEKRRRQRAELEAAAQEADR